MEISAKLKGAQGAFEAMVETDGTARAAALPADANGGELLMMSIAACYANDLYREAARLGVPIESVEVVASARFDGRGVPAADARYTASVISNAPSDAVENLLRETDAVAEVHKSLRGGTYVRFDGAPVAHGARAARPADAAPVTLREITADTVRGVLRMSVAPGQENFVAPNAVSLSQALFSPEAWYRAAYRGDELVGFVMVSDEGHARQPNDKPTIGLWRLMVDQRYQGQGIGKEIVGRVVEHARERGYDKLFTSYVPNPKGPEKFYLDMGFVPTGEVDGGEVVAALEIVSPPTRG